jgi:hypothetical protein
MRSIDVNYQLTYEHRNKFILKKEKVEKVRQRKREEEEKKLHPKEKERETKRKQV